MKNKEHKRWEIRVEDVRSTWQRMRRMCDTTKRDLEMLKLKP